MASALVAEAEACRDGVRLLNPTPGCGVVLETDSLELVSARKARGNQPSEIATILTDIQELVRRSFHPLTWYMLGDRLITQRMHVQNLLLLVIW